MKHEETPRFLWLGILISLVAYLFFITASSLVWSFKGSFPVIQILFVQNVVSLLCAIPFLIPRGVSGLVTRELPTHLIRDFAGVLSYYLYFVAIRYLGLVDATVLNYTAPFFVPLFWRIWMKERVGRNVWWSIVIGFIGVAVILNPTKQIFQLGFVLGICAGILSGVAFCAIRVLHLKKEPTRRILSYYFALGVVLSFPFAWIYWIPPDFSQWMRMIGIGVATVCGQVLLTVAYRYGTASYLSPLGYTTVIYSGLVSVFLFDRTMTWRTIAGGILIIIGGSATYLLKKRPRTISETFQTPDPKEKPPL